MSILLHLVSCDLENTSGLHGKLSGLWRPNPETEDLQVTGVWRLESGSKEENIFENHSQRQFSVLIQEEAFPVSNQIEQEQK